MSTLLRHPGSNRNDAAPTGNTQFLGGAYAGRDGGGARRSCGIKTPTRVIGCLEFKPQTGGKMLRGVWRCAECLAKKGSA